MKNYQLSRAAGGGAMVFDGDASRPTAICHEVEDAQRIVAALNHADALADALRECRDALREMHIAEGARRDYLQNQINEALRAYAGDLLP